MIRDEIAMGFTVYYSAFVYGRRCFLTAATERGLCLVMHPHESLDELSQQEKRRFYGSSLVYDDLALHPYHREMAEYFTGKRLTFELPVDIGGTSFQLEVWNSLRKIPYGETRSYAEIATSIGRPKAVRAVGTANKMNPLPIIVPCHRVIGKDGGLGGYRGGNELKTELLQLERRHRNADHILKEVTP